MARRAVDTTEPLMPFSLHLPVAYKELFESIEPRSHSAAVRTLLKFALESGALAGIKAGLSAPAPATVEAAAVPYLRRLHDDVTLAARRCVRDHAQIAKLLGASDVVLAASVRALLQQPTTTESEA